MMAVDRSGRAGGAVDGEAGGRGVAGGPGALEADGGAGAGGDRRVVVLVGDGHALTTLGGHPVPGVGDLLITREGEAQRPAVDRRRASVGEPKRKECAVSWHRFPKLIAFPDFTFGELGLEQKCVLDRNLRRRKGRT